MVQVTSEFYSRNQFSFVFLYRRETIIIKSSMGGSPKTFTTIPPIIEKTFSQGRQAAISTMD